MYVCNEFLTISLRRWIDARFISAAVPYSSPTRAEGGVVFWKSGLEPNQKVYWKCQGSLISLACHKSRSYHGGIIELNNRYHGKWKVAGNHLA